MIGCLDKTRRPEFSPIINLFARDPVKKYGYLDLISSLNIIASSVGISNASCIQITQLSLDKI
jgi:hypothetical protein